MDGRQVCDVFLSLAQCLQRQVEGEIDIISDLSYPEFMSEPVSEEVKAYLRGIGAKGGKKSRRKLDPAQARRMVAVREARRAFRENKTQCFWSFNPEWKIEHEQVPLVIRTLRTEGNAKTFALAKRIAKLHAGSRI